VGQILDALLGAVTAINADTGVGVGDRVGWSIWVLGHFFSPSLPGWKIYYTEPEEAQAQQILARLDLPPAWQANRRKRKTPTGAGVGKENENAESLYCSVILGRVSPVFVVVFVMVLCSGPFSLIHGIVPGGGGLSKGKGRHRDGESEGEY
jgi:hypothetical protein